MRRPIELAGHQLMERWQDVVTRAAPCGIKATGPGVATGTDRNYPDACFAGPLIAFRQPYSMTAAYVG
jgi:hypothetical protein